MRTATLVVLGLLLIAIGGLLGLLSGSWFGAHSHDLDGVVVQPLDGPRPPTAPDLYGVDV